MGGRGLRVEPTERAVPTSPAWPPGFPEGSVPRPHGQFSLPSVALNMATCLHISLETALMSGLALRPLLSEKCPDSPVMVTPGQGSGGCPTLTRGGWGGANTPQVPSPLPRGRLLPPLGNSPDPASRTMALLVAPMGRRCLSTGGAPEQDP